MTDQGPRPSRTAPGDETAAQRHRRLAAVFGDPLPETTRDERDPDPGETASSGETANDAWLRSQVPPHHG